MPCWYYEEKELRNTPSIQDGISYEDECRYRREGSRFIIDVGNKMDLIYTTMATGVVYFHRFYMFHSFKTFPRYVTACCCLFLAGKVEETPKKCKDIIKTAKLLLSESKFATFGDDPKEEVMTLERILLQTIKFDLQVEHPYSYLLKYAKCLKGDKAKLQKMVQMAWTFVNDSLCTTLCLQWEPEIIAVALMYLAGKLSTFEVVDWTGRQPKHTRWWDMFLEDVEMDLLETICHEVLDLYSASNKTNQPESPPLVPSKEVVKEKFNVPKPIDMNAHSNNGQTLPKATKKETNSIAPNGRMPIVPEIQDVSKPLEIQHPPFPPYPNYPPTATNYPPIFPDREPPIFPNINIPPPIINNMNHIPPPLHHIPPTGPIRPMPTTPTPLQQIQPFGTFQPNLNFPSSNPSTPSGLHRPFYPPPS